jgi:curved DNA-binding protein CbpA
MTIIANERMLEINEAYATLSDPVRRRAYDLPLGYCNTVSKFKIGSKVRVCAHASPFHDHIGVVDQEPIQGGLTLLVHGEDRDKWLAVNCSLR